MPVRGDAVKHHLSVSASLFCSRKFIFLWRGSGSPGWDFWKDEEEQVIYKVS